MVDLGMMGVDWEQRIDFDRLRRERLQKAKDALRASEADVLFVFRTEDARYLTGYRHHLGPTPLLGNATVVLTPDDDPLLFTMDHEHCRRRMPWLPVESIQPRANFREEIGIRKWAELLRGLVGDLNGKTIGVDLWGPTLEEHLKSVFPKSRFIDGYKILMEAKILKTADEIACLKVANAVTEAGMDAALATLRPGVRECEVLAAAWQRMTALGSEWTQCSNIVCSGPYTAPYRRFTSDRVIREGDLVIIDIGGCFNGYWGDLTRTWVCGDIMPTPAQMDLHQKCYEALWNACAAARAGNTTADVFAAADPYVLDSLGHGSGVAPWEPPYFSPHSKEDPLVLRPGMQFNLEPYAGRPGIGGVRLEHNLVVTEGDPDIYTTYPFDERLVITLHPLDTTTGRTRRSRG
ncbi:MAG TPA: Xaa-Pro peptidase family protein [Candidatus Dormibacteraeota bacterium]|nr:Xaa-Pro peptidase family protein [Candidatus Dormibacteraeota bacterium]